MIYQGAKQYPVRHLRYHTSDTPLTWMTNAAPQQKLEEIRRWHKVDRGWKDIGYHWVIDRNGVIMPGRAETTIGAGIIDFNRGVIHVCLIGGKGGKWTDNFAQHYTKEQEDSLLRLTNAIIGRTGIQTITGHYHHAPRECPCFNVERWLIEKKMARYVIPPNKK